MERKPTMSAEGIRERVLRDLYNVKEDRSWAQYEGFHRHENSWRDVVTRVIHEEQNGGVWQVQRRRIEWRDLRRPSYAVNTLEKNQWEYLERHSHSWSLSRRVWLEIMGLPIHIWSEDSFERIAKAMDGKLVMLQDLMDECASFSIVRILVDTYQWQLIQDWIIVKFKYVDFYVYIKEFGIEVLSQQFHHDDSPKVSEIGGSLENSLSESMASPVEKEMEVQNVGSGSRQ
ncbi:hypothetical protein PIB30_047004 [Stylosanthes scabra]|uniref:DUF4283 domain-containing protein n=1 Tax=Stylosanthes scabra TaxID=79078 RepID=A0ABU6YDW8_9FABA|nr:hypothetical protein [Stylosanthes scabra]